ncbi:MAG: hypothetical protein ABIX37_12065, partial [Gammaproteobacteria bacterium]
MNRIARLASVLLLTAGSFPLAANAITQVVQFNVLNASATLPTAFNVGDNLRLDTLVTSQVGALLQAITFTVGANVDSLIGEAAWEVNTVDGTGPRLSGVNIDIVDASDAVVISDTFLGTLGGFAISGLSGSI